MKTIALPAAVLCLALTAFDGCATGDDGNGALAGGTAGNAIGAGGAAPTLADPSGSLETDTSPAGASAAAAAGGAPAAMGPAAMGSPMAGSANQQNTGANPQPNAGSGSQDASAGSTPDAADASMPTAGTTCLKGSGGSYEGDGPYAVRTKEVTIDSFGDYTIYYPDPLEDDCPHPLVAWGNGYSISGGTAYATFNGAAASWGIVVIVSHYSQIDINDGSHHTAGIDYMLSQNDDPNSEFYGKLSGRAGVAGHSMGGAGSERAATHPAVTAIVNMQGTMGDRVPTKPFLCLTGTNDAGAMDGCPLAVDAMTAPAMVANWQGADHVNTTLAGGTGSDQYARLYSAWMRCFVADDGAACALFMGGADCPVCKEPGWAEIYAHDF